MLPSLAQLKSLATSQRLYCVLPEHLLDHLAVAAFHLPCCPSGELIGNIQCESTSTKALLNRLNLAWKDLIVWKPGDPVLLLEQLRFYKSANDEDLQQENYYEIAKHAAGLRIIVRNKKRLPAPKRPTLLQGQDIDRCHECARMRLYRGHQKIDIVSNLAAPPYWDRRCTDDDTQDSFVDQLLQPLNPEQKAVVLLTFEGKSCAEIAAKIGTSVKTVRRLYQAAMDRLREIARKRFSERFHPDP